jgi:hypothetical protein
MGIRFSSIILGAILAGIGLFWVLGTTIAAFGFLQTFACIVLTIALGLFYLIGYSDGKNAHYLTATAPQIAGKKLPASSAGNRG